MSVTDDRTPGSVVKMLAVVCPVCDAEYHRELPATCPDCEVELVLPSPPKA